MERMSFYIPPVFLFGNQNKHNQGEKKAEYKTATETEIQIENRNIKRIAELEEENKKLKDEITTLKMHLSKEENVYCLAKENERLKEEKEELKKMIDGLLEQIAKLKGL